MDNEVIITRLKQIEAWAEGLRQECFNTRRMLEADSSASNTRKGILDDLVARAVAERNQRMAGKASG